MPSKPWKVWLSRNTKICVFVESPQTSPAFIPFWTPLQPPPGHVHVTAMCVMTRQWSLPITPGHSVCPVTHSPCARCSPHLQRGLRVGLGQGSWQGREGSCRQDTVHSPASLGLCSTSLGRKEEGMNALEMELCFSEGGCSF